MKLIDVHAHLEGERFAQDLDEVIERAKKANMTLIINSGVNPESNRRAKALSEKYGPLVKASFGIYPVDAVVNHIKNFPSDDVVREIKAFDVNEELSWIEKHKDSCIAIGEVGLDYKMAPGTEEEQKKVFSKVIELAKKIDKPLIIHSRGGEADAIDLLHQNKAQKVILHCFSGKKSLIKKAVDYGFFLSVPPVITRLDHFKTLVSLVPLTQLITETDAPYLSPVAGQRNEPANVISSIQEIAKIKKLTETEVADQIFNNAKALFKL